MLLFANSIITAVTDNYHDFQRFAMEYTDREYQFLLPVPAYMHSALSTLIQSIERKMNGKTEIAMCDFGMIAPIDEFMSQNSTSWAIQGATKVANRDIAG